MRGNENTFGDFNRTFIDLFKTIVKKGSGDINIDQIRMDDERYTFKEILGRGAAGLVYKAWEKHNKRFVAVKVSKTDTENFISETKLSGRLKHDNIIEIYDTHSGPEISYVVMEYIRGNTLKSYCNKQNQLPLTRICEIMINICKGLHHAHENGIIHKDIKPSNILLNKQGKPKISDFGISQEIDGTEATGFQGTPGYVSPEQLKDERVTKVSDIFSLGCVLYELIEGKKAFAGENPYTVIFKIMNDAPEPLTIPDPKIRKIFQAIIDKALAKKPENRDQTCHDLAYKLSKTLALLNKLEKSAKKPVLSSLGSRLKGGLKAPYSTF